MADFEIKRNDLLPAFRVPLFADGAPLDLTNALSVDFIMKSTGSPDGITVINAPAVIETPKTGGIVRYDWALGDTAVAGAYTAEVEIHWSGSKPQTAPTNAYWTIDIGLDLDGAP